MSKRSGGLLTQAEVDRERLSTMARVFQRADRVLSGESIRCTIAQGGVPAPAWSDGEEIAFNAEQIGSVSSVDDIIKVTGLNYHELSHVLYTPRKHTAMVKAIISAQVFPAFNMLEDQRIETLLSTKYPSTKPYFVACIMRYLLGNRQQWDTAFPLLHGRKYLPLEVRQQAEARFKDPHLVLDFKRIINEYRTLAYPRDEQRGLALVKEYAALLGQMTKPPSADPNGHGSGRPEVVKGQPQPHDGTAQVAQEESKDEDDADAAEGQGQGKGKSDSKDDDKADKGKGGKSKDEAKDDDADDTDDDAQGSGSGDDFDDEDDADDDWDADDDLDGDTGGDNKAGSQQGDDSNSDDDGDDAKSDDEGEQDDASSKGGKGAGKGGSYTPPVAPVSDDDFADLMDKAASSAEQDEKVQEEVRDKQDVIVKGDGEVIAKLDQQGYVDCQVPPTILQTAKRFGRDLRRLRDEVDPGWHNGQSAGRLNVGRAMRGDDLDTVFDKWDEGKHLDADIEVVILLDYSDSMASMMDAASQSMWTIKRAFEEIGGRVTVIGYSYGAVLMYDGNTKVRPSQYKRFAANGGTQPDGALKEALRLLHASKRKSKFLISITDGAWGGFGGGYTHTLNRFNDNGVVTAMLYLMRPNMNAEYRERITQSINWQGHTVQAVSDGAEDLANLSMGIVKARLRQPQR
jgi:hypothetical protein